MINQAQHQRTVQALTEMPDRLEQAVSDVPRDLLRWEPETWDAIPGERFSVVGQIAHLRDIEIDGYQVRFARMLDEHRPDLASLDGYALARERRYAETDLSAALSSFRNARRDTVARLAALSGTDLQRRGTFAEYGEVTVGGLVHLLSSHDWQHLACIEWLLLKHSSR